METKQKPMAFWIIVNVILPLVKNHRLEKYYNMPILPALQTKNEQNELKRGVSAIYISSKLFKTSLIQFYIGF